MIKLTALGKVVLAFLAFTFALATTVDVHPLVLAYEPPAKLKTPLKRLPLSIGPLLNIPCKLSVYSASLAGCPTTSGKPYNPDEFTCAVWTRKVNGKWTPVLPMGTVLQAFWDGRHQKGTVTDTFTRMDLRTRVDLSKVWMDQLAKGRREWGLLKDASYRIISIPGRKK